MALTVSRKTNLIVVIVLLVITSILLLFYYQRFNKYDSHVINVAGRQRMLSQKISKIVFSVANGNVSEQKFLIESIEIYGHSLKALEYGGNVMKKIVPPSPIGMSRLFERNKGIWRPFRRNAEIIAREGESSFKSKKFLDAVEYIRLNNEKLLRISNKITERLARTSKDAAIRLKVFLIVLFGVDILIVWGYIILNNYAPKSADRLEKAGIGFKSIKYKILFPIPIVAVIGIIWTAILVPKFINDNVLIDSIKSAKANLEQFKMLRVYYTEKVVKKIFLATPIKLSTNHDSRKDSIPLPVTMIHDLSQLMSAGEVQVNIYSPFPFPNRKGRLLDSFEKDAWVFLKNNPSEYYAKLEDRDGVKLLRVAVADVMSAQTCIDCHNSYPETPKNDWKIGDVRGVLEESMDVTSSMDRGITMSWIVIGIITIAGFVFMVISLLQAKDISVPLVRIIDSMSEMAKNKRFIEIPYISRKDEIGQLAKTFNTMVKELAQADSEIRNAWYEAKEASRIKTEFLANMSHEIRTPMNGIIGFSDILIESDITEEQKESLDIIKNSADSLLEIINDILDISKVESGKLTLEKVEFDIEVLIYDVCKLIKFKASDKNIEVLADVGDFSTLLSGDPTRLRQILTNLMGNACKFTEFGEIGLNVSLLKDEGGQIDLKFAVHDTGIGIPEDKLDLIFNPFIQADGSTTRKFGGTGLGLAISKKLSEMMGGEMWVESKLGKGSTFYFTAKFKKAPYDSKIAIPINPRELFEKQAIIVDDNKHVLNIILRMLKGFGVTPIVFERAKPAIEYLRSCEKLPDFGIIDMMMPEMDGLGFMELIQRDAKLSKIPFIIHSSNSTPGDSDLCKKAGFAGYLPKPTQKQVLLKLICSILGVREKEEEIVTQYSVNEDVLKNTRILVVEDNLINQKLIVKMLSKLSCKVDIAGDGLIAIEKLKGCSDYDLVFMDMQMPNMGGVDATKKIREFGNKVPIIAMTANAMKGDKDICMEAGMNDYLSKPIKKEDVIAKIAEWSRT